MTSVIYYPQFCPPPEWLKVAALCWDTVYRIRTADAPSDPLTVTKLDSALGGVLDDISFERIALDEDATRRFKAWAEAHQLQRDRSTTGDPDAWVGLLGSKFEAHDVVDWLKDRGLANVRGTSRSVEIPRWDLEVWKRRDYEAAVPPMDPVPGSDHEEYERLKGAGHSREAGVIRRRNLITVTEVDNFVYMPRDIALDYLSIYASSEAERRDSDLASGDARYVEPICHPQTVAGTLSTSLLEAYLPQELRALKPAKIAQLRNELAVSRLRYQGEIRLLRNEFGRVSSHSELERLKGQLIELARARMDDTRRTYTRAKVTSALQVFQLGVTPSAAALWAGSALDVGLFAPLSIAANLGLTTWKLVLDWQQAKSARRNGPWSYVLDLKKSA